MLYQGNSEKFNLIQFNFQKKVLEYAVSQTSMIRLNEYAVSYTVQYCTVEWADVGTRPRVSWIYVVFHIKIRQIEFFFI
jgi:hypothetical protein